MPTLEEIQKALGRVSGFTDKIFKGFENIQGPGKFDFTPPVEEEKPDFGLKDIIEAGLKGEKLEGLSGRAIVDEEQDFLRGLIKASETPSRLLLDPEVRELAPQEKVKPKVLKNLDPDKLDIMAEALGEATPIVAGAFLAPAAMVTPIAGAVQGAAEELVTEGGARFAEGDLAGGAKQVALGAGIGAAFGGLGVGAKKVLNKFTQKTIEDGAIKGLPIALHHLQEDTELAMERAIRGGGDFEEGFQRELTQLQSRRRGVIPPERALVPVPASVSDVVPPGVSLAKVSKEIGAGHTALHNIEVLKRPLKFASEELEAIRSNISALENKRFSPLATGKISSKGKPTSQQFVWDTVARKSLRGAGLNKKEQDLVLNQFMPWERQVLARSYEKGANEAAVKIAKSIQGESKTFNDQLRQSLAKELRNTNTARSPWTGQEGFVSIGNLTENAVPSVKENMGKFRSELKRRSGMDGAGVWYTAMLSSVGTLMRNLLGNAFELGGETAARGLRGVASGDIRQAAAQFSGMWNGLEKAGKNFAEAWKTGLIEEVRRGNMNAIAELTAGATQPVSGPAKWIKIFPRAMAATDDFFSTIGYYTDIYDQAYRVARKESGGAVVEAAERLAKNPTNEMIQNAMEAGRRAVFRDTPEGLVKTGVEIGEKIQREVPYLGRWVLPFVRTPLNLGKRSIEFSPAGFGMALTQAIKGETEAGAKQFFRASVGSTAAMGAYGLAAAGGLTGRWAHLSDGEKSVRYAKGERPMSIRVGDKFLSYDNLGPVTALLNIGASTWEEHKDTGKPVPAIINGLTKETIIGAMESTFIPQFWDLFSGLVKPDQYGEKGIQSMINSLSNLLVPRPAQDLARIIDPTIRERTTDPGKILAPKIPGATTFEPESASLPRLGLFGETLKREGVFTQEPTVLDLVSPSRASNITQDPVILELDRLQKALPEDSSVRFNAPGFNASSAGMSKQKFETAYTEEEVFGIRKAKGFLQRKMLEQILQNRSYQNWDDVVKAKILKKRYDKAGSLVNKTTRAFKQNNRPVTEAEILRAIGIN